MSEMQFEIKDVSKFPEEDDQIEKEKWPEWSEEEYNQIEKEQWPEWSEEEDQIEKERWPEWSEEEDQIEKEQWPEWSEESGDDEENEIDIPKCQYLCSKCKRMFMKNSKK